VRGDAAVGYCVYFALLHTQFLGIFSFPNYASPHVYDLGWAVLVGLIAGLMGILFKVIFGVMHLFFARLQSRPVIAAMVGGVVINAHSRHMVMQRRGHLHSRVLISDLLRHSL